MDDKQYQQLADKVLARIETMLEPVDAEDVDVERAGDVLTLTFRSGKKAVLNTQRPTRQIWLAANARAWHFDWDASSGAWIDDKGQKVELVSHVASIVRDASGIDVSVT